MIAVQTLNLQKYYEKNNTDEIKLQLTMSIISSYLLRKHYDRVILYADKKTAETLSDTYYTEIRILPFLSRYSCFSSLKVMSNLLSFIFI